MNVEMIKSEPIREKTDIVLSETSMTRIWFALKYILATVTSEGSIKKTRK